MANLCEKENSDDTGACLVKPLGGEDGLFGDAIMRSTKSSVKVKVATRAEFRAQRLPRS